MFIPFKVGMARAWAKKLGQDWPRKEEGAKLQSLVCIKMNWFKERVGIQEPIYGSSAIQPVTDQTNTTPWTELKREDLQWATPGATCVETQCFYVTSDSGHLAMAQIIYNCLAGLRTTCQFSCKVYYPNNKPAHLWTSDTLENWGLDDSKTSFHAKNLNVELSEDGNTYTVKSSTSTSAIVDLKFIKSCPGVAIGKDGTSYYGTDPAQPWGKVRHAFWPRCKVEGSIMTQSGEIPMTGPGIFIHALQGIKPNFAASSWNFFNFQSPTHSAIMMELTTPPSYGSTVVTVGIVAEDGKVLCAGGQDHVTYTNTTHDEEVGWNPPESAKLHWKSSDTAGPGEQVTATLSGSLGIRFDRVDVLAQIPAFLKTIIAAAANSKPYIYQYGPEMELSLSTKDEKDKVIKGTAFIEATFITG